MTMNFRIPKLRGHPESKINAKATMTRKCAFDSTRHQLQVLIPRHLCTRLVCAMREPDKGGLHVDLSWVDEDLHGALFLILWSECSDQAKLRLRLHWEYEDVDGISHKLVSPRSRAGTAPQKKPTRSDERRRRRPQKEVKWVQQQARAGKIEGVTRAGTSMYNCREAKLYTGIAGVREDEEV
ncbi:hypothetical protein PSPO01_04831 [Paraphaeosphaeria sporulosa]